MLAEFEKNQLETGEKLSTDERLRELQKVVEEIALRFVDAMRSEIHLRAECVKGTNMGLYEYELSKLLDQCKDIMIQHLCEFPKQYENHEERMARFAPQVTEEIVNQLNDNSIYIFSRSEFNTEGIMKAVQSAAEQWFLTLEECKQLKNEGYWSMKE